MKSPISKVTGWLSVSVCGGNKRPPTGEDIIVLLLLLELSNKLRCGLCCFASATFMAFSNPSASL